MPRWLGANLANLAVLRLGKAYLTEALSQHRFPLESSFTLYNMSFIPAIIGLGLAIQYYCLKN